MKRSALFVAVAVTLVAAAWFLGSSTPVDERAATKAASVAPDTVAARPRSPTPSGSSPADGPSRRAPEGALAARLGPKRARELRLAKDGWPGPRLQSRDYCSGGDGQMM